MNVTDSSQEISIAQNNLVMLQTKRMPVNKYNNGSPMTPKTSRVERLLRERELRKSSRCFQQSDEPRDGNKEAELLNDSRLAEGDIWAVPKEEDFYDAYAFDRGFADGCQWQDGRPAPLYFPFKIPCVEPHLLKQSLSPHMRGSIRSMRLND